MLNRSLLLCTLPCALAILTVACKVDHSRVVSMTPSSDSTVAEPPERVEVEFDRAMNGVTITDQTFVVEGSEHGRYDGVVTYHTLTSSASFVPSTPFERGETITVTLSKEIESNSNKKLRTFVGAFSIAPPVIFVPDPIQVVDVDPSNETIGLSTLPTVRIAFDQAYNPFTVTEETVFVYGSRSGTITPTFPNVLMGFDELTLQLGRELIAGERVTVILGAGLASVDGARLATTRLSFTVEVEAATGAPVLVSGGSVDATNGRIVFLDADGDGRDEWVVIDPSGALSAQETVAGTPTTPELHTLPTGIRDHAVGDFDGDGRSDLACLSTDGTTLYVLNGSSIGSSILDPAFSGTVSPAADTIVAGGFDFDRAMDLLVVPATASDGVRLLWGASPTPFLQETVTTLAAHAPVLVEDFDGDGTIDVAHRTAGGDLGFAFGTPIDTDNRDEAGRLADFAPEGTQGSLPNFERLVATNVDLDEHVDVVLLAPGTERGVVFLGNGDRTFTEMELPMGATRTGSALADFDGDGRIDAITPELGGTDVTLWSDLAGSGETIVTANVVQTVSFGDTDGDGVLELALIDALGQWELVRRDPAVAPVRDLVWATDITAEEGTSGHTFEIRADHESDLDGFTVAIAVDPLLVAIDRFSTLGSDSETVGVELELPNLDATNGTAIIAVVYDFLPPFDGQQLLAGEDRLLLTGELTILPLVGDQLTFIDVGTGIGSPPSDTAFVVAGLTVDPTLVDGEVTVTTGSGGGGGPTDTFSRGDLNEDGFHDIADANFLQAYLFTGGPAPACLDAADVNDDGAVDGA
ncbi:MAG: FG-GAP-like repeat-containing protein, partial [Planctomycetota bacterium]